MSEILYSEYQTDDGEFIFEKIKNHRGTTFMIKKNPEVTETQEFPILHLITGSFRFT